MLDMEDCKESPIYEEIREEARDARDAEWIMKLFEQGWRLERIAGMMNLDLQDVEQATGTKRKSKYEAWAESCGWGDYKKTRYYREIQEEAREETLAEMIQKMSKHGLTLEIIAATTNMDLDAVKKIIKKKKPKK